MITRVIARAARAILLSVRAPSDAPMAHETLSRFAAPAMTSIEAAHRNYLATLQRCLDTLERSVIAFDQQHPVFRTLRRERVQLLRVPARLHALDKRARTFPSLSSLADAIETYYSLAYGLPVGSSQEGPREVAKLAYILLEIANARPTQYDGIEMARRTLRNFRDALQMQYAAVEQEYRVLQFQLLASAHRHRF